MGMNTIAATGGTSDWLTREMAEQREQTKPWDSPNYVYMTTAQRDAIIKRAEHIAVVLAKAEATLTAIKDLAEREYDLGHNGAFLEIGKLAKEAIDG